MNTHIRKLDDILESSEPRPSGAWNLRVVQSAECMSYVAWNESTKEALIVDPKIEDWEAYLSIASDLKGYLWLAVIDTHTHADHISVAAKLARELKTSLVMHENAPSQKVNLRVKAGASLPSKAAPVLLLHSPGHTQDSITVFWGPYLFGGDTILFGDTGRDDLPGGDPEAHYASVQKIKAFAKNDTLLLPGHDNKGGRVSSWNTQLKLNASLSQAQEDFVKEAAAFSTAAPLLLKESLKENFK